MKIRRVAGGTFPYRHIEIDGRVYNNVTKSSYVRMCKVMRYKSVVHAFSGHYSPDPHLDGFVVRVSNAIGRTFIGNVRTCTNCGGDGCPSCNGLGTYTVKEAEKKWGSYRFLPEKQAQ